jgi:hypothetical protein
MFIVGFECCVVSYYRQHIVTGSRYADCHCYTAAGYVVTAAGVTEFPEICAVASQRKAGCEFHIRSND